MRQVAHWVFLAVLALVVPAPVAANHVPLETLLQRMFTDPSPTPYDVTANFNGTFVFVWRGGTITARLKGSYREWRQALGQPRRRQVAITEIDVPFVLRPLIPGMRKLIEDRIEQEEGALSLLEEYDIFIIDEQPNGRFFLGAVRTDIVRSVMKRYARNPDDVKDPAIRRAVARWLYQPAQREMVMRGGGPYVVTVQVDEQGTYYSLLLLYEWGPVGTQLDWATVAGRLIWQNVKMDAQMDARGIGRVNGKLDMTFSNHCYNCTR